MMPREYPRGAAGRCVNRARRRPMLRTARARFAHALLLGIVAAGLPWPCEDKRKRGAGECLPQAHGDVARRNASIVGHTRSGRST